MLQASSPVCQVKIAFLHDCVSYNALVMAKTLAAVVLMRPIGLMGRARYRTRPSCHGGSIGHGTSKTDVDIALVPVVVDVPLVAPAFRRSI